VQIQLSDRDGRFEVVVADSVPGAVVDAAAMRAAVGDSAPNPAGHAAAVARIAVAPQPEPGGTQPGQQPPAAGSADAAGATESAANGGLPADIGLAVIAGLADDVDISATGGGVSIRMSWPTA
jgi:hypothetical protein